MQTPETRFGSEWYALRSKGRILKHIIMKPHFTPVIAGIAVAAAAFFAVTAAHSDQPEVVPPVAPVPAADTRIPAPANSEQYRIVSMAAVQNERDVQRMEETLNKLALEGWRVRTGVGAAVIMSR